MPADTLPLLRGEVAFRLLVEAVADYAIFLLAPDGRVMTWNLGAQRIKGYEADEIIGQHFSRFYTDEERAAGRPEFVLARAAEFGRFESEGWRVRKDGSKFWADVVITALREDPASPPYAYVKITRDLTERREAERQQRVLLSEQRARAAAEDALAALDRFLAIASHELRTPVATLQLATETMLRSHRRGSLDAEKLETGFRRILSATERLGALMGELLDVSRLAKGGPVLNRVPTDIVALAREVADRFDEREGTARIRLVAPDEAWLDLDGPRIDQVITNLVDNALKYSSSDQPVELVVTDRDAEVEIRILDRGIGLDEATRGRLFEAFGRGANAEHIQGMGLGLFISHRIVTEHGGRIEADSRPDAAGAVFTVTLPRKVGVR
jgi:hypothetical protein